MRLSLQSHKYRAEHWFIVSGSGLVQLENEVISVQQGNSVDIPIGAKHRITCTSDDPLVFVEVQTGISFDENDITRYEDDFGRN
jgi:mannose-6-phosphate isomerase-like protein (cupin superfamily)